MKKIVQIAYFIFLINASSVNAQVSITEEKIIIPTYLTEAPDNVPMFYLPENYQNAQLRIYPYHNINRLKNNKADKEYTALYLENKYIKVCVIPELGGRLYTAEDKINGYDFFYRNNVIKPALIGMTGAWISGGVEWNVPHHHRASTYMPIDCKISENTDGSKTIWVGEYEKRSQTRWVVGLTLYPDKSYIEVALKHLNVRPVINSFLFWANAAVAANDDYQVIFPPDVERVTFHNKSDFSDYPISHQVYVGIDFRNTDISWWKNTFSPTSFFAWGSKMDFTAGIDHGKKAGTICVADHRKFSGQKYWNWGKNDIQELWDQMLTDNDGPYLELMTGMYSDNQPDYAWNAPFDVKQGIMYYFPLKNMKSIKNATENGALSWEVKNNILEIELNVTSVMNNHSLQVFAQDEMIASNNVTLNPEKPYSTTIKLPKGINASDLKVALVTPEGKELISYKQYIRKNTPTPEPYRLPKPPADIQSTEYLYRTGVRLEQFHNPILNPVAYYKEVLERDSNHILTNVKLGENYLKNGLYTDAKKYLEKALELETYMYTTAKTGEPVYYLALANYYLEDFETAYDQFYKATWSTEWAPQAYFMMSIINCLNKNYKKAKENLNLSLNKNSENVEALSLLAVITRNEKGNNQSLIDKIEKIDPLNLTAAYERYLSKITESSEKSLPGFFRDEPDNFLETSTRYIECGCYEDANILLKIAENFSGSQTSTNPLIFYYMAYNYEKLNNADEARAYYNKAKSLDWNFCFPYGNMSEKVLESAIRFNSSDATALYLLGNLLCDTNPERAYDLWKKSSSIKQNGMTYRNMAFIEANIFDNTDPAVANMEKAIKLEPENRTFAFEYDSYSAYRNDVPEKRLKFLEDNISLVNSWDVLMLSYIELLVFNDEYEKAIELVNKQHFSVPEITTINPHTVWTFAYLCRGIQVLNKNEIDKAIADFNQIFVFPRHLEIARDSKIAIANYWLSKAYEKKGNKKKANEYLNLMADYTESEKGFGASTHPLIDYYKGISLKESGRQKDSEQVFKQMIVQGNKLVNKTYHPVSQDRSVKVRQNRKSQIAEGYLYLSLANFGMNNFEEAKAMYAKSIETVPGYLDAKVADTLLNLKD